MSCNIFTLTQGTDDNTEKINQSDRTYKTKLEEIHHHMVFMILNNF